MQIVAFTSDYWTSIVHLRTQLDVVRVKYPVEIEIISQAGTADDLNAPPSSTSATIPSFKAAVEVFDYAMESKVKIDFLFDFGVFAHWPMALKKTKCDVEVLMGPFECVFCLVHQGRPP